MSALRLLKIRAQSRFEKKSSLVNFELCLRIKNKSLENILSVAKRKIIQIDVPLVIDNLVVFYVKSKS